MKRIVFILVLALTSMVGMAQNRHYGHDGGRDGRHRHHIECASHEQMRMALDVMKKQSFDDNKLEIGQLCVTLGHFCVDDLARMAALFSFDDNRLKFLRYAYDYCEDPQNYYALRDVFSFSSNFDELMKTVQPAHHRR